MWSRGRGRGRGAVGLPAPVPNAAKPCRKHACMPQSPAKIRRKMPPRTPNPIKFNHKHSENWKIGPVNRKAIAHGSLSQLDGGPFFPAGGSW